MGNSIESLPFIQYLSSRTGIYQLACYVLYITEDRLSKRPEFTDKALNQTTFVGMIVA